MKPITEFDTEMWDSMVDLIMVDKDKNMTIAFKGGVEIKT